MFTIIVITFIVASFCCSGFHAASGRNDGGFYEILLERSAGCPPCKSKYVTEDSGVRIRRLTKTAKPALFWTLNVTREFPNTTILRAAMTEGHDTESRAGLIEYKKNLCEYLEKEKYPMFVMIKDSLKLPNKCPVSPNFYKLDNFHPDVSKFPPVLPGGDKFALKLNFDFAKDDVWKVHVFIKILKKRKGSLIG